MVDESPQIDTSPIEALLTIQKKQGELRELLSRAEATREKVSAEVFRRVSRDYETRLTALETEAKPLRKKAHQEHARLAPVHERRRKQVDEARLDKEELEFRHEVGELGDEEFAEKTKAAEALLATREKEFAETDDLKQRFVAVMGPAPEPEPPPPPPPPPPAPRVPPPQSDSTRPRMQAPVLAPPDPEPYPVPSEETAFIPSSALRTSATAAVEPFDESREEESPRAEGTMVMAFARLVTEGEEPPEEFQLGLRTSIGRTSDNEIAIAKAAVSRRHALVTFTESGYIIADLKSGNGTFVNDERIVEPHLLAAGDRIKVGSTVFVFHPPEE